MDSTKQQRKYSLREIEGRLTTKHLHFSNTPSGVSLSRKKTWLKTSGRGKKHGSVEIFNSLGQSPLMQSVGRGDATMVMMMLNAGADVNVQSDGSLRTPLMLACFKGFVEIARILKERGARWNIRDRNGCTAVHYAVDGSQQETLSYALDEGADVEARDCRKWTPLMRGVVLEASTAVLTELLKRGAQVNEVDHRGMTCLMFAVLSGRKQIIELLLNFGADIRAVNHNQNTALMMACSKDLKEVIPLLTPPEEEKQDKRKWRSIIKRKL